MAVVTKSLRKHIFVHPGDQLEAAVRIALLKDRRKYSDSLAGALLDVSKIQVVGDRHLVVHGYLSMEVVANFEVFSPLVGMTLEGVINKKNGPNYGCVVKGLFNAYLNVPDGSNLKANEGDSCTFTVSKVIVSADIIFMRGVLCGVTPVSALSMIDTDNASNTTNATDDHLIPSEPHIKQEQPDTFETTTPPSISPKKKSKKCKTEADSCISIEESANTKTENSPTGLIKPDPVSVKSQPQQQENDDNESETPTKSKSKKKHKKKSTRDNDDDDLNTSLKLNSSTSTLETSESDNTRKRKHTCGEDESFVEEEELMVDRKPIIGKDVECYSPSKMGTAGISSSSSSVKIKTEKGASPVKQQRTMKTPKVKREKNKI